MWREIVPAANRLVGGPRVALKILGATCLDRDKVADGGTSSISEFWDRRVEEGNGSPSLDRSVILLGEDSLPPTGTSQRPTV